jgi:phenylacetate-coenzyme A ligase PaaK-like adenylate-forming protein
MPTSPRSAVLADCLHRSQAEIEDFQSRQLRGMLELCARGHPYYRRAWHEAGIDLATVISLDDLEKLPVTPKAAMMSAPEDFRLHLPDLPLEERVLWEVLYTTGTSAEPTPVYNTTHDYHAYLLQSQRVAEIAGIGGNDIIANLFPLTAAPMGAFVRSATNAYAAGASIFAALPGARLGMFGVQRSLEHAVAAIADHRATLLWGVPSFVRRVLLRAVEVGADFRSVRMCVITGEASSPAMRDELRRLMRSLDTRDAQVFDRYGSTELGAFAQCAEDSGWHNPAPEIQYHEIVDPDTGRRLPDGERGALAVTHLNRRGTVLIRFLVGDMAALERGPCPHCGRRGDRVIGPIVRTKDLVKVKGMLINPAALLEALQGVTDLDEFQVVIRRADPSDPYSMDEMVLRLAVHEPQREAVAAQAIERARAASRVTPQVEFATASELYDPESQTKASRFIDQRMAG